ncbi:MAG: hypothetical protein AAF563_25455 [Pseudomonadota bacterium]
MNDRLPFWQRLLITILVMLLSSYVAGLVCQFIFGFAIPSYIAGAIGGLASLPTWDFLKRIRPSGKR